MSTRLKALVLLGAGAMLIAACSSSGGGSAAPSGSVAAPSESVTAAPSESASEAANEKIKVTLLTKATGGFWDAMIAGAKQYETDHPDDIELTTNAAALLDAGAMPGLCRICSPVLSASETRGNRGHCPAHPGFACAQHRATDPA